MTFHASVFEIVWFAIAFTGWIIKLFLFAGAREHYLQHKESYMAVSVYSHMRLMLGAFTTVLLASINGLFNPPPPPPLWETQSLVNIGLWIVLTLTLTAHALKTSKWWKALGEKDSAAIISNAGAGNGERGVAVKLPASTSTTITTDVKTNVKED